MPPTDDAHERARKVVNGHWGMVEKAPNGERLVQRIEQAIRDAVQAAEARIVAHGQEVAAATWREAQVAAIEALRVCDGRADDLGHRLHEVFAVRAARAIPAYPVAAPVAGTGEGRGVTHHWALDVACPHCRAAVGQTCAQHPIVCAVRVRASRVAFASAPPEDKEPR